MPLLTPADPLPSIAEQYITNDGSVCVIRTNKGAPNYRLVKIDLCDPAPEKWVSKRRSPAMGG